MGNTRQYDFIVGAETATLPDPGTPSAAADTLSKGYGDTYYAPGMIVSSWAPGTISPVESVENGEKVWLFSQAQAGTEKLHLFLKVPHGYQAGNQISLRIAHYSPSSSNTQLLRAVAYLIRKGTATAVSSTTNSHTSTNAAITNALADRYWEVALDLSSSTGQVNSVAIAAGDMLRVELYRGSDTDTADIRLIPSATEPRYHA
jgi:hypothetical protein